MKKKKPVEREMMGLSNALTPDMQRKRQQYRNKRRLKAGVIVAAAAVLLLACAVFIFGFMGTNVISELTLEAGDDMVSASDFFEKDVRAVFVSDNLPDTSKPDKYSLKIRKGVLFYNVTLNICDTTAPTAKPVDLRIKQGQKTLSASDFVKNITDSTEVTARFETPIDYKLLGDRDVTIILTDLGANETRYEAKLTIYPEEILPSVTVEAGGKALTVEDFLSDGAQKYEGDCILNEPDEEFYHKVGSQKLEIMYCSAVYTVKVSVEDTVSPTCSVKNLSTYKGKEIQAQDFILKLRDETRVTVDYVNKPDFNKIGQSVVELILEDGGKNTNIYKALLTVEEDREKPQIYAQDRTVYIGDNIRFSEGVRAVDNCDGEIEVQVDIGDFDKTVTGVYPIKFTATDKSGNTAEKTVNFTLEKKRYIEYTQEFIDSNFRPLYNRIIDEGMTDKEKMRAIYDYVRENIEYSGTSEKSSWEQEAYRGIRSKQGDSFTFYSISRKLLTMAGIENKPVERTGSQFSHYWNMVKYDGQWYHFDTCPHYKDYPIDSFMLTDEEAAQYSKKTNGYYTYK